MTDRIGYTPTHSSRSDSMAAALLVDAVSRSLQGASHLTFRDLTLTEKKYKFFSSFGFSTLDPGSDATKGPTVLKPRA